MKTKHFVTLQKYYVRYMFVTLYNVIRSLLMKPLCATIQLKTFEQYFYVVLFIMRNKVVLTFSLLMKPLCVTIQMKAI